MLQGSRGKLALGGDQGVVRADGIVRQKPGFKPRYFEDLAEADLLLEGQRRKRRAQEPELTLRGDARQLINKFSSSKFYALASRRHKLLWWLQLRTH